MLSLSLTLSYYFLCMKGVTKMETKSEWNEFIERTNNFHWNSEQLKQIMIINKPYYEYFCNLKSYLLQETDKPEKQNRIKFLNAFFNGVYTAIVMSDSNFAYFLEGSSLHDNVYNACFFTTLCMFLHETTRAKGKTILKFIYDNSLDYYNDRSSEKFCPFDYPSDELLKNEDTLRKQRHRLLSSRPAYSKRSEWSAIAKDSEYEWTFKYTLEIEDETLKDTFKRIGNLYKDISNVLKAPRDEKFNTKVEMAYKSFSSKLGKIKYEKYLELSKKTFDHINENNEYYGINLYRIEKELRPYITTNEVNQLLACETDTDEKAILTKSVMLNDICFPKVYEDFANFPLWTDTEKCALCFRILCDRIIPINCLIIDELIEKKYFGEDWYDFFRNTINEMANKIFYNPEKIDYTVTSKSQEKYMKILSATAQNVIFTHTGISVS